MSVPVDKIIFENITTVNTYFDFENLNRISILNNSTGVIGITNSLDGFRSSIWIDNGEEISFDGGAGFVLPTIRIVTHNSGDGDVAQISVIRN